MNKDNSKSKSKSKSRSKSKPHERNANLKKSPVNNPKSRQNNIQSKHDNSGGNSPKTIDYSKVIEKYGQIIDNDSSPKFTKNNSRIRHKNRYNLDQYEQSYKQIKQNTKSTSSTYSNETTTHINKKEESNRYNEKEDLIYKLKRELDDAQTKIAILEEEKEKGKQLFLNKDVISLTYPEMEMLKIKLSKLERENKEVRHNSAKRLNEKVAIMLKLFRKYSKKLNQLVGLYENNPSASLSSDLFNDLKDTIEQFNSTINNEKLYLMFNIKCIANNNDDYSQEKYDDSINYDDTISNINNKKNDRYYNLAEFEPSCNMSLLPKYDNKIKGLKEQRDQLTKIIKDLEMKESKITNGLKSKLETVIKENKDLKSNNNYLKNINHELNAKIEMISSMENNSQLQNETIAQLKCQIAQLEKEIKYKESTIASFEKKMNNVNVQVYPNGNNSPKENNHFNEQYNINSNELNQGIDSSTNIFNNKYLNHNNIFNSELMNHLIDQPVQKYNPIKPIQQSHNNKENEENCVSMFNYTQNSFHQSPNQMDHRNKSDHSSIDYDNPSLTHSSSARITLKKPNYINNENENINQIINKISLNKEQPSENLQNEIDILDGEICSLKSKLKQMLTTTNNNLNNNH